MPRRVLVALAAALTAAGAHAAPGAIATGAYENTLLIGYDPATREVSGYFDMQQGGQPTISCSFYLRGRAAGASAAIDTYFPDQPKSDLIRGTLTAQGQGKVRVALPRDHGGCGNVWPFASADQPADFDIAAARPWTAVRVVKAARAYFYASAGAAAHGRAYIVQGDGVGVIAARPGWVEAEYTGGDKPTSGWLREGDLYAP